MRLSPSEAPSPSPHPCSPPCSSAASEWKAPPDTARTLTACSRRDKVYLCARVRMCACVLCTCMCTGVHLQPGDAKRCLLALLVPVPQPAALPRTPREERAIRRDGEGVRGAGHDCGHLEARQGGHLVSTRGKHAVCVCVREREVCRVLPRPISLSLSHAVVSTQ